MTGAPTFAFDKRLPDTEPERRELFARDLGCPAAYLPS